MPGHVGRDLDAGGQPYTRPTLGWAEVGFWASWVCQTRKQGLTPPLR